MSIFNSNQINKAIKVLKAGGLIAYPTETFYGLGADITNKEAVNDVYLLKKRDYAKPLSVAVADFNNIYKLAEVEDWQINILKKYLPGPYTFLLKNKDIVFDLITGVSDLIGIRYPNNQLALSIISKFGKPITATSANISGSDPTGDYRQLEIDPDFIVKGECNYNQGSTIVDLVNRKFVRKGAGYNEIKNVIVD